MAIKFFFNLHLIWPNIALFNFAMNKSLQRPLLYQPITVCIVSERVDIIHSNEVNPALTLSLRLLTIP